ncbi:PEP-CTERM sorting domain-containing protein [Duganella sp. Root198D2]|uniref:PEP-CTERM sorting domain-containing protein n=1 Tax=Duganella sp. Root198D2 TaxID=1736489 RepID=UPI00070AB713|nr:PEP-CTERM sorting domain-containing protein [Duganella sp. Root198D2]KRC02857.1 hypothetical protein ASE26_16750 [Duganella sp. Root198D2]
MNKRILNVGKLLTAGLAWLGAMAGSSAGTLSYSFDSFADSTSLTSQYSGLQFTHATILKSGVSLNEFSFPPHSGTNALLDDGGPIVITFATPAQAVSGYFTYLSGLTMSAYDSSNRLLAQTSSAFLSNAADGTGDPGSVANELLSIAAAGDLIARLEISAAADGFSFLLDDLSVTTPATDLPEPASLALVLGGLALILRRRSKFRHP